MQNTEQQALETYELAVANLALAQNQYHNLQIQKEIFWGAIAHKIQQQRGKNLTLTQLHVLVPEHDEWMEYVCRLDNLYAEVMECKTQMYIASKELDRSMLY